MIVPLEGAARIVDELTSRGYNAEREAVTLIASAENPAAVLERVVEDVAEDALVVRTDHVETALSAESSSNDSVPQSADPVGEHPLFQLETTPPV